MLWQKQAGSVADLLGICTLVGICIFTTRDLISRVDLVFADEAYYMYQGVTFFKDGFMLDWAPLYSLWYSFLHLFETDRVLLHYLNMALLSTLPTFAYYFFLRIFGLGVLFPLLCTVLFHFSLVNSPAGGKVSMFALLIILLTTILIYKKAGKDLSLALPILLLLFYIAAYIRPEFILTFGMGCIFTIFYVIIKKVNATYLLLSLGVVAGLFFLVGSPISQRGELAFKQQFGYHYIMRHPEDTRFENLNVWIDYDQVIWLIFGQDVRSFYEALKLKGFFILEEHFIPNILTFAGFLVELVEDYLTIFSRRKVNLLFYVGIFIVFAYLYVRKILIFNPERGKRLFRRKRILIYSLAMFCISVTVASLYSVSINVRYLPLYYLILPVAILVLSFFFSINKKYTYVRTALNGLLFVAITAKIMFQVPVFGQKITESQIEKAFVERTQRFVNKHHISEKLVVFSNRDQIFTYLAGDAVGYKSYKLHSGFREFVQRRNINLFAFRKFELDYFSIDKSFVEFIENPGKEYVKEEDFAHEFVFIRKVQ